MKRLLILLLLLVILVPSHAVAAGSTQVNGGGRGNRKSAATGGVGRGVMEPDEVSLHSGAEAEAVETPGLSRRALLQRAATSAVGLFAIGATRSAPASAVAWPGASAYDAEVPT